MDENWKTKDKSYVRKRICWADDDAHGPPETVVSRPLSRDMYKALAPIMPADNENDTTTTSKKLKNRRNSYFRNYSWQRGTKQNVGQIRLCICFNPPCGQTIVCVTVITCFVEKLGFFRLGYVVVLGTCSVPSCVGSRNEIMTRRQHYSIPFPILRGPSCF